MKAPLVDEEFQMANKALRHLEMSRIRIGNTLQHLTEYPKKPEYSLGLSMIHPTPAFLKEIHAAMQREEEYTIARLADPVKDVNPLFLWAHQFRGLGSDKVLPRFLGEIGDPYIIPASAQHNRAEPAVRSWKQLQRYTGMSVENGYAPRMTPGVQGGYRPQARVRLYNIGLQLLRQKDPVHYGIYSCARNGQVPTGKLNEDGTPKLEYVDGQVHTLPCARCTKKGERAEAAVGMPISGGHAHARALRLLEKHFLHGLWKTARDYHNS